MYSKTLHSLSLYIKHVFHVVSNVRPLVWICIYALAVPVFALIYWWLPDGQFRIPDGGATDYGSWLYYSIVTISTLGFGDYTPMGDAAQGVTATEVMTGLLCLGFFLNAVGSMKSEIDVESEVEKQKRVHEATETEHLKKLTAPTLRVLHAFVNHCHAVESASSAETKREAIAEVMKSAARTALALDALQTHVDLIIWPDLLEDCFAFVANYQILSSEIGPKAAILTDDGEVSNELKEFISENSDIIQRIEAILTKDALPE